MIEKLRFGLVGCGVIGPLHSEAISSQPDAQLGAVVDVVTRRAEELAKRYGARAYTGLPMMLAREYLDAGALCVPGGLHGEYACDAMRAGCHVILEAIDKMLRVQKGAGSNACGHQSAPF